MDSQPAQSPAAPVIVVKRGVLSSNAAAELRKAGYRVIFSSDPTAIKTLGAEEAFKDASDAAKVKTVNEMLSGTYSENAAFYKSMIRQLYVHFLKNAGNF